MVKSRKEKITDNVKYIWLQTERFVKAYYNKDVQLISVLRSNNVFRLQ